jgi:hypothetical protein
VPLAAKVCLNFAGLAFSFQTDAFQDILDYSTDGVGPLLCALCGFMWFVQVRPISSRFAAAYDAGANAASSAPVTHWTQTARSAIMLMLVRYRIGRE